MEKEEERTIEELQNKLEAMTANRDYWRGKYDKMDEQYRLFRKAVENLLKLADE